MRWILGVSLLALAAGPAAAIPEGYDACKFKDLNHQTPKYVVGRIVDGFPHTPEGLRSALPIIAAVYPGTTLLNNKDKVRIPCVGEIDLLRAASGGGAAWQWLVVKNECTRKCCEEVPKSSRCGADAGGHSEGAGTTAPCRGSQVPNMLPIVEKAVEDAPDAWSAKLIPDKPRCSADSRFLDHVIDELRRHDRRWGYNCKRGDCGNPSHDVVAYYFGKGEPYEGAVQVMLVDFIASTCGPNARPAWTVLDFGPGAGWTGKGRLPSGPRQDVTVACATRGSGPAVHGVPVLAPQRAPAPQPAPGPPARPALRPVGTAPRRPAPDPEPTVAAPPEEGEGSEEEAAPEEEEQP